MKYTLLLLLTLTLAACNEQQHDNSATASEQFPDGG